MSQLGYNLRINKRPVGQSLPPPAYTTPNGSPTLAAWADPYTPNFNSGPVSGAPLIGPVTLQGQPGDAIAVGGSFPSSTTFETFTQTTSVNKLQTTTTMRRPVANRATISLNNSIPNNSLILLYAIDGGKYSTPAVINRAEAWWLCSGTTATSSCLIGDTIFVHGRNLSKSLNWSSGYDTTSPNEKCMIWLYTAGRPGQYVDCTAINPYCAEFVVPALWQTTSSNSTATFSTGTKNFNNVASGLGYINGMTVSVWNSFGHMSGTVQDYTGTTLTVLIASVEAGASGSRTGWTIEPTYNVEVYLHNGHGGAYGWSKPLTLSVRNRPALGINYDKNPPVQIAAPNGTDDTAGILLKISNVGSDGPVCFQFQPGIYRLSSRVVATLGFGKACQFKGHADGTTITLADKMLQSTSSDSVSLGTGTKNFTVETGLAYVPGQYIRATAYPNYIEGSITSYDSSTGALVINSTLVEPSGATGTFTSWNIQPRFTADEMISSNANSELNNLTIDVTGFSTTANIRMRRLINCTFRRRAPSDIWVSTGATSFLMTGCHHEGPRIYLQNVPNVFVNNNDFYGTDAQSAMGEQLFLCWGGYNIRFTNNRCQHFNSSGTYADKIHGRIFWVDGGQYGSVRNVYLAHNTTPTRLNNPVLDYGDGEMFAFEGALVSSSSMAISANSTSVTISTTASSSWILTRDAAVVGGRGEGQVRKIVNVVGNTLTIDPPWDLTPDNTSRINVCGMATKTVIYDNQCQGGNVLSIVDNPLQAEQGKSQGFNLFSGGADIIADGNTFTDMNLGYSEWAISGIANITQVCPLFFNVIQNNSFVHCNYGIWTTIDNGFSATGFVLGVVRRRNTFTNLVTHSWYQHSNWNVNYVDMDIMQSSSFSGGKYGLWHNGNVQNSNACVIDTSFVGNSGVGSKAKRNITVNELGTTTFTNFLS